MVPHGLVESVITQTGKNLLPTPVQTVALKWEKGKRHTLRLFHEYVSLGNIKLEKSWNRHAPAFWCGSIIRLSTEFHNALHCHRRVDTALQSGYIPPDDP